jgi:hypothetical protein
MKGEMTNCEDFKVSLLMKFCGLEMSRSRTGKGLLLGQEDYLQDLLRKRGLESTRPTKIVLDKEECRNVIGDYEDDVEKASLVREAQRLAGELVWLAQKTRLDISYSVSRVASMTLGSPRRAIACAKRVLRYLASTRTMTLTYYDDEAMELFQDFECRRALKEVLFSGIIGFTDASFAPNDHEKRQPL